MQKKLNTLLTFGLLSLSVAFSATTFAAKNKEAKPADENIDVTQQNVTKDELAAIYVLSEVCPALVKQDKAFNAGYDRLLKEYLPNEKKPETALKSMVKQSSFKQALNQAREDAQKAGDAGNEAVCQDVKDYQS